MGLFHFIFPFLLCGFLFPHLFYLHFLSSNNPLRNSTNNKIPFFPFIFLKDLFGLEKMNLFPRDLLEGKNLFELKENLFGLTNYLSFTAVSPKIFSFKRDFYWINPQSVVIPKGK